MVFIRHRKQENSPFTTQISSAYVRQPTALWLFFIQTWSLFQNILHLSPATRIPDKNPEAEPGIHCFLVLYFQGEKKDRIGHFYSTGLQVKQLVLIFTILLNSEHPCCHMYRVNVHVAQSLFKDDVLKIMHLYLMIIIT